MIVAALVFLLIIQQLFWSITTHRLVNKLMCRNYFEYKQAEQAFTPQPQKIQIPDPEEDMGILDGMGGF